MFKKIEKENFEDYKNLFGKHNSVSIFNYAFDNKLGTLEIDNLVEPKFAKFSFVNFMFFSGKANENKKEEILATFPPLVAIVAEDKDWYPIIENYFSSKEGIRFAQQDRVKFSSDSINLEHLNSLKKPLPEGYSLKEINKEIVEKLSPSLRQHISLFFGSNEDFLEKGMGFCILDGE